MKDPIRDFSVDSRLVRLLLASLLGRSTRHRNLGTTVASLAIAGDHQAVAKASKPLVVKYDGQYDDPRRNQSGQQVFARDHAFRLTCFRARQSSYTDRFRTGRVLEEILD